MTFTPKPPMTHEQFLETVKEMRQLQTEYFKTRDRSTLDRCRFIEKVVDMHIYRVTNPQPSLFE
ncbi:MAG: hypothetical protein NW214_08575 [Pseudanabaenaceae cyanobacterium bins.39]|nr:hypothetical protein [Pseudanabaenaceae cyanobacterium bins.39]